MIASKSSFRNMKTVVDQKHLAPRIIWPKLLPGLYLVPVKEALIPRTQDIKERTNQRIFLDVEPGKILEHHSEFSKHRLHNFYFMLRIF